jgi:hypothetical protein
MGSVSKKQENAPRRQCTSIHVERLVGTARSLTKASSYERRLKPP